MTDLQRHRVFVGHLDVSGTEESVCISREQHYFSGGCFFYP